MFCANRLYLLWKISSRTACHHFLEPDFQTKLSTTNVQKLYPQLFQGLGTLGDEYQVSLKDNYHSLYQLEMYHCHYVAKYRKNWSVWNRWVLFPWWVNLVPAWLLYWSPLEFQTLESECSMRVSPFTLCRGDFSTANRNTCIYKVGCQQWVLAARNSRLLTTFITPFGRYCFHKLPLGITSAPELFQRCMSSVLNGLSCVVCLMDDVLVFGKNQAEHDEH